MAKAGFVIRPMQLSDLDEVYAIEETAHIAPWSKQIIHDCIKVGYPCYVLAKKRKVQGFAINRINAGDCHLLNLCIANEAQGKGFGKAMLLYVIDKMTPVCTSVTLEVRPTNEIAINLYHKHEFVKVGYKEDYYTNPDGSHEDAIVLSRALR
jgi:ribosomal-protein-alanine N-acetyltransferase